MKALYITRYGGPEVLELRELPDPTPGPGELRIRVERSGLNFADVSARVGLYPDAPRPPMVMGYEVAGIVDALGDGVESSWKGARVFAFTQFGGHADTVVAREALTLRMPDSMSFDHAAALPVNYLTAFHILFHVHSLKPRAKVLLHAAAGGVGQAVVQLSKLVDGVELFGTASAAKHPLLKDAGVLHPIDYRTQDYAEEVMRLTGGRGVDLILDPLGGPDTGKNYELLAKAGHLVCFGWSNMVQGAKRNVLRVGAQVVQTKFFSPIGLMDKNRTVSGVNLGHLWDETELLRGHMSKLIELHASGKIAPHIDRVFPLSEAASAHSYMQDRKNVGKLLFDCSQ